MISSSPFWSTTSKATTSSSGSSFMAMTPPAVRPIGRTSVSAKRIAMALRLTMISSSVPALVVLPQIECDDPVPPGRVVGGELGLLDDALPRGDHQVLVGCEVLGVEDGRHRLLGAEGQDVTDGDPPGDAFLLGDLVGLDPVHLAAVGEHQHKGVVGGGEHLGDDVAFLGLRPDHTLAATALGLVDGRLGPLDVARPRD